MYPKVKAKNLSYKINEKNLFQNISFELFPSRAIHIQGDNGSVKTTLLKNVYGLENINFYLVLAPNFPSLVLLSQK